MTKSEYRIQTSAFGFPSDFRFRVSPFHVDSSLKFCDNPPSDRGLLLQDVHSNGFDIQSPEPRDAWRSIVGSALSTQSEFRWPRRVPDFAPQTFHCRRDRRKTSGAL